MGGMVWGKKGVGRRRAWKVVSLFSACSVGLPLPNSHVLHSLWLAANILSYFFGWLLYNAGGPRARSLSPKNMKNTGSTAKK